LSSISLVSKPNEIFEAFVDVVVGGGGGKEGEWEWKGE
jgi:hypothetical protein